MSGYPESQVHYEPGMSNYRLDGASFIEGLPGIGLVGKVAVSYILGKVKAKKICRIYSPYFSSVAYISDGRIIPNFTDLYAVEEPAKVLIMYGSAQPSSSYGQYEFCQKVIDIASKHGATRVFTVGGLGGKEKISPRREIFCSSTDKRYLEKYLELVDGQVYSGQIVGAVGILINLAGNRGLENMCMLVEIGESTPDYFAARRAVEAFIKLTGLNIELNSVEEIIKLSNRVISQLET